MELPRHFDTRLCASYRDYYVIWYKVMCKKKVLMWLLFYLVQDYRYVQQIFNVTMSLGTRVRAH